jgi:hypothetical protein
VVPTKVIGEKNDMLLKPIGPEEVKNTLFQMFLTKAPGPDGFPAHFFQKHYWDLCGNEVTTVVLHGDDDPAKLINTNIFLIPKVENPKELGWFWPISLCNVIYKIASKMVASRLHAS